MTTDGQYIAVRFRPEDTRTYTYVNHGVPARVGDRVKVPDPRGGWKPVEVVEIVERPKFECKPIIGIIDGADIDARLSAPPEPKTGDLFA